MLWIIHASKYFISLDFQYSWLSKGEVIIYNRDGGGRDMGGGLEKDTVSKAGL